MKTIQAKKSASMEGQWQQPGVFGRKMQILEGKALDASV